jgi:hypothetical protein
MTTSMDTAGGLVLPKAGREPAAANVTVELRGGFWVAASAATVPALTQAQVDVAADALRVPAANVSGDEG